MELRKDRPCVLGRYAVGLHKSLAQRPGDCERSSEEPQQLCFTTLHTIGSPSRPRKAQAGKSLQSFLLSRCMSLPDQMREEKRHQLSTCEGLRRVLAGSRRNIQCAVLHLAQHLLGRLEAFAVGVVVIAADPESPIAEVDPILEDIKGRWSEE